MSTGTTGNKIDTKGVNHPRHYNLDPSGIECIEIVRYMNFNIGNALKYLFRAGLKIPEGVYTVEAEVKDFEKALWYIDDELKHNASAEGGYWFALNRVDLPQEVMRKIVLVAASRQEHIEQIFRGFYMVEDAKGNRYTYELKQLHKLVQRELNRLEAHLADYHKD